MKVIVSLSLSKGYDRRYVVVDETTGEVLDDAQGFMADVEQAMFYAMKDADSFTKADVEHLLSERGVDLPFSVQDLMRHW